MYYLINNHQLVIPILANSATALPGLQAACMPVHVLTPGSSELKEFLNCFCCCGCLKGFTAPFSELGGVLQMRSHCLTFTQRAINNMSNINPKTKCYVLLQPLYRRAETPTLRTEWRVALLNVGDSRDAASLPQSFIGLGTHGCLHG